jgi:hypothetical protein
MAQERDDDGEPDLPPLRATLGTVAGWFAIVLLFAHFCVFVSSAYR